MFVQKVVSDEHSTLVTDLIIHSVQQPHVDNIITIMTSAFWNDHNKTTYLENGLSQVYAYALHEITIFLPI